MSSNIKGLFAFIGAFACYFFLYSYFFPIKIEADREYFNVTAAGLNVKSPADREYFNEGNDYALKFREAEDDFDEYMNSRGQQLEHKVESPNYTDDMSKAQKYAVYWKYRYKELLKRQGVIKGLDDDEFLMYYLEYS